MLREARCEVCRKWPATKMATVPDADGRLVDRKVCEPTAGFARMNGFAVRPLTDAERGVRRRLVTA